MGNENDCTTPLEHTGHDMLDKLYGVWVESRVRFVQQEQIGSQHDFPGELDPALHPV